MRILRTESKCGACPLDGTCQKVRGISESEAPRIVVLGESPGSVEVQEGLPFVGPAGRMLHALLREAGLNSGGVYLTNVISCQPPEDNFESFEGQAAAKACAPGLEAELTALAQRGAKVILAVGNVPMRALGIEGKITKNRGSVYVAVVGGKTFWVVPTYHPSFLIRGNQHQTPTVVGDIAKVMRIAADGWKPPTEDFHMFPTIEWLEAKTEELCTTPDVLRGLDIEGFRRIVVVGIAETPEKGFSIPFLRQGGEEYWPDFHQRGRAEKCLAKLLETCLFVAQNAAYDFGVFTDLGYKWRLPHDTMLLHHVYNPELPHDLGYISSQYADTPYWKDILLASEKVLLGHDDLTLRTYNLRDAVVLLPIYQRLRDLVERQGTLSVYEQIERPLLRPVIALKHNGMRLISSRLPAWKDFVTVETASQKQRFKSVVGAPPSMNPASLYHKRWTFLGQAPENLAAKRAELAAYDEPGCKKKKTTKVYRELVEFLETFDQVIPLPRLKGTYKRSDSGQWALDKQAFLKMAIMANAELAQIDRYVRLPEKFAARADELRRMVRALEVYGDYSKWAKLGSTYTTFKVEEDGRVHPSYLIHGTRTGRLASRGPNWQNLPPIVKHLFGPAPGNAFVLADFSNIEMRVMAFETEDEVLQADFAAGRLPHNENVRTMFGLEEDHPMFKVAKRAAKTYIFGRGYGGGLYGIFERTSMQVPELGLTFQRFKEIDAAYRAKHPAYFAWADKIQAYALEHQEVSTATGRVRKFIGSTESEIKREALNTPIQGVAGDVANNALIEVEEWCRLVGKGDKLISAIHDSIGVECKLSRVEEVAAALVRIMEKKRDLWGRQVSFPVEVEIGVHSWGETMSLEDFKNGNYAGRGDPDFTGANSNAEWGDGAVWEDDEEPLHAGESA